MVGGEGGVNKRFIRSVEFYAAVKFIVLDILIQQ